MKRITPSFAPTLAPELGRAAIYQVNARGKDEEDRRALSFTLQGRTFLRSGAPLDQLLRRHYAGWTFQKTRISEEYSPERYLNDLDPDSEIVLVLRRGQVLVNSREVEVNPEIGDVVIAYAPKTDAERSDAPDAARNGQEVSSVAAAAF